MCTSRSLPQKSPMNCGDLMAKPAGAGMLWNIGVTLGFLGILTGNASGLEGLQMPGKVLPLLFFGFVLVGLSLVQTNNRRTDEEMSPAQWFLFAATLWLPWVLAGSYLLIHFFIAGP